MAKQILDISPMVADFGEFVDFFTSNESTITRGIYGEPTWVKTVVQAAVFPYGSFKLSFDVEGVDLSGAIQIFTKSYFPISKDKEVPSDSRVRYDGSSYRLIDRLPYFGSYYVYVAQLLRVDPDALPE